MHGGRAVSCRLVHRTPSSSVPLPPSPMEMQCEILASHLSGRFTDLHGPVCEVAPEQSGDFLVGRARGLPHPLHRLSRTLQCLHAVLHNIGDQTPSHTSH